MAPPPDPGGSVRPAVVVVTDSTASLPAGAAQRWGIEVVPLEVGLGDVRRREGVDLAVADLLAALGAGTRVTTSQPPPSAFAAAYARAAQRGARAVVSVHLSGELSGTVRAAEVAAADAPVPVRVVDSRTVAMGLGFAALAAAEVAAAEVAAGGMAAGGVAAGGVAAGGREGTELPGTPADDPAGPGVPVRGATAGGKPPAGGPADVAAVAERARAVAASTTVLFVVDSLDHLRRGGRIGSAAATVGGLLGMRPLLTVRDGRVEVAGTVRTRRAARERLVETAAAESAARPGARLAVHHLGRPDLGDELADAVRARVGGEVLVADVSAVVGAHAGPGLLGVVIADR